MSEIPGTAGLGPSSGFGGPSRLGPNGAERRGDGPSGIDDLSTTGPSSRFEHSEPDTGFETADRVEISARAQESSRTNRLLDSNQPPLPRFERIAAARRAIRDDTLESPDKLRIAIQRMIREL